MLIVIITSFIGLETVCNGLHHPPDTCVSEVWDGDALAASPVFSDMAEHAASDHDGISRLHANTKSKVGQVEVATGELLAKDADDGPTKKRILPVRVEARFDVPQDLQAIVDEFIEECKRSVAGIHLHEPALELNGVIEVLRVQCPEEDVDTVGEESHLRLELRNGVEILDRWNGGIKQESKDEV